MEARKALELYFSLRESFPIPSTLGKLGKTRNTLQPGDPSSRLVFLATVGRALRALTPEDRQTLERYAYLLEGENLALRRVLSSANALRWISPDLPSYRLVEYERNEWRELEAELSRARRNLERRAGFRSALSAFTVELDKMS